MPWRENCVMDERMRFIVEHGAGELSMTELCEEFGVSRQTGYEWLRRYRADGPAGLADRPRGALRHGRATPEAVVEALVSLRRERPTWGPRKLLAKLSARAPSIVWPSASTAGEILKRAGLVTGRRLHRRAPPRLGELTVAQHPNHLWRVDHKGWVRLGCGGRLEPLTMTDGFSRYLVELSATGSTREAETKPLFEQTFAEHGLPEAIRSDNGPPFACAGATGLTGLSVWWLKLGIRHERIDPGSPQQNGGHERFHLTLLEAMTPPERDRAAQQARFDAFRRDYNLERPHEALGQVPPASLYTPSPRPMPDRLPEPVYPPEAAVRKVRSNGEIKWRGDLIHVSTALVGEPVAVEETEDGHWRVRFCDQPIGRIDTAAGKVKPFPSPKPDTERSEPKSQPNTA